MNIVIAHQKGLLQTVCDLQQSLLIRVIRNEFLFPVVDGFLKKRDENIKAYRALSAARSKRR